MNIKRNHYLSEINTYFSVHPIVGLLGPRQAGKTTLAREFAKSHENVTMIDLEDPTDLARLQEPKLALQHLNGLVVIDEIQRMPDLFPVLRVLVDRPENKTMFLILGSASRELIRQSSETLAGRIGYIELSPFAADEIEDVDFEKMWLQGGFPKSYLAKSAQQSQIWLGSYIADFLERDIPNLGIAIPAQTLRRFWMMLSHYHGQTLNYSELGRSFGIADTTVKKYTDILQGTFMIRLLQPWFENISKRQVKSPKLYIRDSGIYHWLLGIKDKDQLFTHPKIGASWEGFALETVIQTHKSSSKDVYFWATHADAELDLMIIKDGKRLGFEFKYTDKPTVTKSMKIAMQSLGLDTITIVFPGHGQFPLSDQINACGLASLVEKSERKVGIDTHSELKF